MRLAKQTEHWGMPVRLDAAERLQWGCPGSLVRAGRQAACALQRSVGMPVRLGPAARLQWGRHGSLFKAGKQAGMRVAKQTEH